MDTYMKIMKTEIQPQEQLQQEYTDQSYWKVELYGGKSVDDLLAEMDM